MRNVFSLSVCRAEAAKILLDGLPQTEQLCLKVIPKVLYDDDVELHRVVIEICGKLIAGGKNNELREMLEKFQEVSFFTRVPLGKLIPP